MNTEFLKNLGLTDDQVNKIFAENGKDIASEQRKTQQAEADRDNYKGQLETAQNSLKEFDGVDIKDLQGKLTQLQNDLKTQQSKYEAQIAETKFEHKLADAINKAGGKNAKAIRAMIDNLDDLKGSKNQDADITAAIEAIKKDNDYMFNVDGNQSKNNEPINFPSTSKQKQNTPDVDGVTAAFLKRNPGLKI